MIDPARLFGLTCALAIAAMPAVAAEFRDLGTLPTPQMALLDAADGDPGAQIAAAINLDAGSDLVLTSEKPLIMNLGRALRFDQTFGGIPIFRAEVVVSESTDGTVSNLSGQVVVGIDAGAQAAAVPSLSPEQALAIAKQANSPGLVALGEETYRNEEASLVYVVGTDGNLVLAYYTTFMNDDRATRPVIIIDANTGAIIDSYENIQTDRKGIGPGGNTKTGQYGWGSGTFPMFEVHETGADCDMDGPDVLTENLNHATNGPGTAWRFACFTNTTKPINGAFDPLNDAHYFGQVAFDMYKEWYGASPLTQKLHLRVHYSNAFENAFWDGQTMTFGDGATRFYPLVSIDVVSHELSHGFTEQNSGLEYRKQSGGINEAFSDMAGEAAEFYFVSKFGKPFTRLMPDLETGADIFKQPGKALRYMCDPPKDGRSIGHVNDYVDGLDVHYSSGVFNKAFCLLSQRPNWSIRKAFDIFALANQAYWTSTETFQSAAEDTFRAADQLHYNTDDVVYAFQQVGIDLSALVKTAYLHNTLRVISSSANRGCGYAGWDCMTNLCRADLQDPAAWRGWSGCYQDQGTFQCYFECGQRRKFY